MSRLLLIALLIFAVLPSAWNQASPAYATSFVLNSTNDEPDATPGDGFCASAPSGHCTLRGAIMEANAQGGSHTITLPANTITLTVRLDYPQWTPWFGDEEDQGARGDLDILADISIVGAGADQTFISNASDRVFDVWPSGIARISGLTIQNSMSTEPNREGAGIRNSGTLYLTDTNLLNNETSRNVGSRVVAGPGAGLYSTGTATLTRTLVRGNQSFNGAGGGVYSNGTLTVLDSEISGNDAHTGGGMVARGTTYIDRTLIAENSAIGDRVSAGDSAGLSVSGNFLMLNSTVSGNTARHRDMTDSGRGGGLSYSGTTGHVENSTFKNNIATWDQFPTATGDHIFMYTGSALAIRSSVVDGDPSRASCVGTLNSFGFNLDSGTTCGLTTPSDRSSTNPLLGALANNGGLTRTHLPQAGSLLIDKGSPDFCPSVDQRYFARPFDGDGNSNAVCDIGAVEIGSVAALTPTATPTATATFTPTRTFTPSPTATLTPVPTVTWTPTVSTSACSPRPRVDVQTSKVAFGRLGVSVISTTSSVAPVNKLKRIRFEQMTNTSVDIRGQNGRTQPFAVDLQDRPQQTDFAVSWVTQGQFTVQIVVEDDCGEWRTFIGGGPRTFE